MKKDIVITGSDANFFPFLIECIDSLMRLHIADRVDLGVMDFGLDPAQVEALNARGIKAVIPQWTLNAKYDLKKRYEIGYVSRTALPQYFPGYDVYLWFDSDAWAQTGDFIDELIEGARQKGAAVIREDGKGMARNFIYNKWWYGNMMLSYGAFDGIRVARKPTINTGILAIKNGAPHWGKWIARYEQAITKARKINLDQHSFNAAVELDNLPVYHADTKCNWVVTLSPPHIDPKTKRLYKPDGSGVPLSIVHLAGPDKRRIYNLKTIDGKTAQFPLSYADLKPYEA